MATIQEVEALAAEYNQILEAIQALVAVEFELRPAVRVNPDRVACSARAIHAAGPGGVFKDNLCSIAEQERRESFFRHVRASAKARKEIKILPKEVCYQEDGWFYFYAYDPSRLAEKFKKFLAAATASLLGSRDALANKLEQIAAAES